MRTQEIKRPQIIFEDKYLLIIDKPSGLVINDSINSGESLQSWLKENFNYKISKNDDLRSGIVHRLDKPTSGIVIVAKDEDSFFALQNQFAKRQTKKTYKALVHGKVKDQTKIIDAPIGRNPENRTHFSVIQGGRDAVTQIASIDKIFTKNKEFYSLLTLNPKTGRTHQLRVHLKHIGNPIVSDHLYAGRKTFKKDIAWCPRLFLHAAAITFSHPFSNEIKSFSSNLPSDLEKALLTLESVN